MSAVVSLGLTLAGCSNGFDYSKGRRMTGGDPIVGKRAIFKRDCTSCHVIPGFEGNTEVAGPALSHWAKHGMIEDTWPNTPENLERWIRFSETMNPETVMKLLSVNEKDAKDISAYLFSLQ